MQAISTWFSIVKGILALAQSEEERTTTVAAATTVQTHAYAKHLLHQFSCSLWSSCHSTGGVLSVLILHSARAGLWLAYA